MLDEKNIIELYQSGLSLRNVEAETGIYHGTVLKILKKNNVPRRGRIEGLIKSKQNSFPINPYLLSVIEGELLGDGHINKGRHQSCFSYGTSKEEYANWLSKIFIKNGIPLCGCGVYKSETYDKRYNKTYKKYHFSSLHSTELKEIRENWYLDNIKKIPNNFELNLTKILHWWIGDGHLNKKGNYGWLFTDNFSKNEVKFLSSQLCKFNINNHISKCKIHNKYIYRIYIPKTSMVKMLEKIGTCPVSCYDYKWNVRRI